MCGVLFIALLFVECCWLSAMMWIVVCCWLLVALCAAYCVPSLSWIALDYFVFCCFVWWCLLIVAGGCVGVAVAYCC